jgi:hypothetical protein
MATQPADSRLRQLLHDVHGFLGRFVAHPSLHARVAHTMWIAHVHAMGACTPRIAFLSPEPGSGKTLALELTETMVPWPVEAVNGTPAYLFRKVGDEARPPTILFDERSTRCSVRRPSTTRKSVVCSTLGIGAVL